ncbi:unnamed protein product [marine sediment metagenome]|uniref:Uncharacterized protein n=1 Tax=marine sediment metagenome TaxID=412755 RepID=X1EL23_9ZZZZ
MVKEIGFKTNVVNRKIKGGMSIQSYLFIASLAFGWVGFFVAKELLRRVKRKRMKKAGFTYIGRLRR